MVRIIKNQPRSIGWSLMDLAGELDLMNLSVLKGQMIVSSDKVKSEAFSQFALKEIRQFQNDICFVDGIEVPKSVLGKICFSLISVRELDCEIEISLLLGFVNEVPPKTLLGVVRRFIPKYSRIPWEYSLIEDKSELERLYTSFNGLEWQMIIPDLVYCLRKRGVELTEEVCLV